MQNLSHMKKRKCLGTDRMDNYDFYNRFEIARFYVYRDKHDANSTYDCNC